MRRDSIDVPARAEHPYTGAVAPRNVGGKKDGPVLRSEIFVLLLGGVGSPGGGLTLGTMSKVIRAGTGARTAGGGGGGGGGPIAAKKSDYRIRVSIHASTNGDRVSVQKDLKAWKTWKVCEMEFCLQ